MKKHIRQLFWHLLDPLLLRMMSRSDHLKETTQNKRSLRTWHEQATYPGSVTFFPETMIANYGFKNQLIIGEFTHIRGELSVISPKGSINIGHHSFIGPHSRVWSQESVTIGNHVLISHLVDIHDSNAHSLDANTRRIDSVNLFEKNRPMDWSSVRSAPVVIEDDVWIGFKSSVLKGVHIGKGAVVAAGSVVTDDVSPYTLVAGNPARVIRSLNDG